MWFCSQSSETPDKSKAIKKSRYQIINKFPETNKKLSFQYKEFVQNDNLQLVGQATFNNARLRITEARAGQVGGGIFDNAHKIFTL